MKAIPEYVTTELFGACARKAEAILRASKNGNKTTMFRAMKARDAGRPLPRRTKAKVMSISSSDTYVPTMTTAERVAAFTIRADDYIAAKKAA
jgi:hypothetical protein